jgi:hypothetical protein
LFELIVIVLCLVVIVLLLVARSRYARMDDDQVLCFTRARAVLLKEKVKPKDAKRFAREHLIMFHVILLYLFLVVGVALTVVSMYYVTRSHLPYLPYVRVTSREILLDTKFVLAVAMIVSYWALFIVYFYAGRSMTRRESEAIKRCGAGEPAGEAEAAASEAPDPGSPREDTAE